ncbi:uncharacterized protein K452DRAFT_87335 [Aplosporella prunicola CBS 121167]|uniref:Uncharacterized protein n=1 Tax=Aplosporella prunicola CBS 121167 TaxID=1176127 RepID=A0A6A6B698_9PEZI|nr:uncharacterized protein K452DRAFT_87335 [Aplosporella prunicola CBS 121167]KAF2138497.1 hypothetical protein K452DRAFT_87335 [Aplosporella prunicola CBS 121167]
MACIFPPLPRPFAAFHLSQGTGDRGGRGPTTDAIASTLHRQFERSDRTRTSRHLTSTRLPQSAAKPAADLLRTLDDPFEVNVCRQDFKGLTYGQRPLGVLAMHSRWGWYSCPDATWLQAECSALGTTRVGTVCTGVKRRRSPVTGVFSTAFLRLLPLVGPQL